MARRPDSMTPEQFNTHRAAALATTAERASVESNPTDVILDLRRRVEALESKKKVPAAPKAKAK